MEASDGNAAPRELLRELVEQEILGSTTGTADRATIRAKATKLYGSDPRFTRKAAAAYIDVVVAELIRAVTSHHRPQPWYDVPKGVLRERVETMYDREWYEAIDEGVVQRFIDMAPSDARAALDRRRTRIGGELRRIRLGEILWKKADARATSIRLATTPEERFQAYLDVYGEEGGGNGLGNAGDGGNGLGL